jgi:hypothetical protein
MELKTPTPLGAEEETKEKKKESVIDKFLNIAEKKKEERTVTFPDLYVNKKKDIQRQGGLKLKTPTPLDVQGVEEDQQSNTPAQSDIPELYRKEKRKDDEFERPKVENNKPQNDIPDIFKPEKVDKGKYQREKVQEIKLKTPKPLGEKISIPKISLNKISLLPLLTLLKKLNPLPLIKKLLKKIKLPKINLTPEQKKKATFISLVSIPVVLLLALGIAILIYVRSEPYNLAKEFLQRIEDRNIEGAYELTTDAYQAVTTKKDFSDLAQRLYTVDISNAKRKKKSINNEGDMGKYAFVRYQVSGYYLDITVFNDEAGWGIHSIELDIAN